MHISLPERRDVHGTEYLYMRQWLERTDLLVQYPQLSWRINMGCHGRILRHVLDGNSYVCWKSGVRTVLLYAVARTDERVSR